MENSDPPVDQSVICDKCGQAYTISQWPWCPHGIPAGGIQPDSFGSAGCWVENLGAEPTWVTGRQDMKRKAEAAGLRWVPEGITGAKPLKRDDDMRGRYNGGATPTFRELHRPAEVDKER